jgi:hypothetical protein
MKAKKLFMSILLVVIALGTLAIVVPTPIATACLFCVPPADCPPCTHLGGGSCFRCPYCVPTAGCKP